MTTKIIKENIWDEYTQEKVLGIGTYGKIYKAFNKKKGNYVAIKEIDKSKYTLTTKNIFSEAEIMKILNSENIVSLLDTKESEKYFYLIMELCLTNLEEYIKIRKNPFSIDEVRQVLNELNNSFKKMKENNIIHRDIKPSNILLSSNKIDKISFKLSDFGLSKSMDSDVSISGYTGVPLTIALEVLKGELISDKSDIWSLGIIIYFMLFKDYPYKGKVEAEIVKQIESNKKLNFVDDDDLNDLLKGMLNVDVNKRISWDKYFNHKFFHKGNNDFNFNCVNHSSNLINNYCTNCKSNICNLCLKQHLSKNHKIISFLNIGLNKNELNQIENLLSEINIISQKINQIKYDIETYYNKVKSINTNNNIYENDKKNNFKQYILNSINEQIKNLKNLSSYNNISNTLNSILNIEKFEQLTKPNLKKIKTIEAHNDSVYLITLFPSGNLISISGDQSIKIWNESFNLIQNIEKAHDNLIYYVDVKDENNFASCSFDEWIKIWQRKNNNKFECIQQIEHAHDSFIVKVLYDKNGKLYSCSYDKTIRIFENKNNNYQLIHKLEHNEPIQSILLLEDLKILVSSGQETTKFFSLIDYKNISIIKDAKCKWSHGLKRLDNDKIIIGGDNLKIISIKDKKIIKEIDNSFKIREICIIKNRGIFLVAGWSKDIKIYRIDNYNLISTLSDIHKEDIYGITVLKNNDIVSYSRSKFIQIWNI